MDSRSFITIGKHIRIPLVQVGAVILGIILLGLILLDLHEVVFYAGPLGLLVVPIAASAFFWLSRIAGRRCRTIRFIQAAILSLSFGVILGGPWWTIFPIWVVHAGLVPEAPPVSVFSLSFVLVLEVVFFLFFLVLFSLFSMWLHGGWNWIWRCSHSDSSI